MRLLRLVPVLAAVALSGIVGIAQADPNPVTISTKIVETATRFGFPVAPLTDVYFEGSSSPQTGTYELAVSNKDVGGPGAAAAIIGVGGASASANLANTVYVASGGAGPPRMTLRNEVPNGYLDVEVGGYQPNNLRLRIPASGPVDLRGSLRLTGDDGTNVTLSSVSGQLVTTGPTAPTATATPAASPPPGLGLWASWNPTVTQGGAVGFTTTYAQYTVIGKVAIIQALLQVTGAGVAGQPIEVGGFPVQPLRTSTTGANVIGTGTVQDVTVGFHTGHVVAFTSGLRIISFENGNFVGATPNFALASGDRIGFSVTVELA